MIWFVLILLERGCCLRLSCWNEDFVCPAMRADTKERNKSCCRVVAISLDELSPEAAITYKKLMQCSNAGVQSLPPHPGAQAE